MATKYQYDPTRALIDLAAHIDLFDVTPPISINLCGDEPQVQVNAESYQEWKASITEVHPSESLVTGDNGWHHISCAVRIGDSVFVMSACANGDDMSRLMFELLVGWPTHVDAKAV